MAKITSGILGKARGKIGGVVASTWKNVNYVRTLVTPANPNTAAQAAARLVFKTCATWAMGMVGAILNVYMSPFLRGMSGFNWAVKTNRANFVLPVSWGNMLITHGSLFAATILATTPTAGVISISYSTDPGSNGMDTDAVYLACFDQTNSKWFFAAAEVARSLGSIECNISAATGDTISCYLITARRDAANRVTTVSDSQISSATAA